MTCRVLRSLPALALALVAASCSSSSSDATCTPKSCADLGRTCGSADDGCGKALECGSCEPGLSCDAQGACVACTPEDASAFCARASRACGTFTTRDNCNTDRTETCGTCEAGLSCSADGRCETCSGESDADFCRRLDAECASITANDICGNQKVAVCGDCSDKPGTTCNRETHKCFECTPDCSGRSCGSDGCGGTCYPGCSNGQQCNEQGQCVSTGPANDTCDSAERIKLTSDSVSATGDLTGAAGDYAGSCGGNKGGDVVFRFTLGTAKHVQLTVLPSASLAPVLILRSDCLSNDASAEIGCNSGTAGQTTYLYLINLAAGDYYVIIDSGSRTGGTFELIVDTYDVT